MLLFYIEICSWFPWLFLMWPSKCFLFFIFNSYACHLQIEHYQKHNIHDEYVFSLLIALCMFVLNALVSSLKWLFWLFCSLSLANLVSYLDLWYMLDLHWFPVLVLLIFVEGGGWSLKIHFVNNENPKIKWNCTIWIVNYMFHQWFLVLAIHNLF